MVVSLRVAVERPDDAVLSGAGLLGGGKSLSLASLGLGLPHYDSAWTAELLPASGHLVATTALCHGWLLGDRPFARRRERFPFGER